MPRLKAMQIVSFAANRFIGSSPFQNFLHQETQTEALASIALRGGEGPGRLLILMAKARLFCKFGVLRG